MRLKKCKNQLSIALILCVVLVIMAAPSRTIGVTAAAEKIDVCHVTNVPADGDGHIISIADPAWIAHEEHGDKQIGEPGVIVDEDGVKCHVAIVLDAIDDEVTTPVDTPVTIDVLANDVYIEPVVVSLQVGPSHGLVGPWVDGSITYYPDNGFIGTDSFTYQICGISSLLCDSATVTIIVGP